MAPRHKLAACAIARGTVILKYNCPIGSATRDIAPGEYVHTHSGAATAASVGVHQ